MLACTWSRFKNARPKLLRNAHEATYHTLNATLCDSLYGTTHENAQVNEAAMDLRSLQKPLKEQYRADPTTSRITIRAQGAQTGAPIACSVDIGRAIHQAEAHKGVGGAGAGACSGDLLLGALAACAQITCQMVAAAMSIPTDRIEVMVEGELDLRGTLGMALDPWPDTGGSQFFITDSPQPHLDAKYTVFGRVIAGMEVVDQLEQTDVIRRVRVPDGVQSSNR